MKKAILNIITNSLYFSEPIYRGIALTQCAYLKFKARRAKFSII
jgi:hypothetical protein